MPDFIHLFIAPPDSSLIYTGVYDAVLVAMSLVVAVLASYAALLVSLNITQPLTGQARRLWLIVAVCVWVWVSGPCISLACWPLACLVPLGLM